MKKILLAVVVISMALGTSYANLISNGSMSSGTSGQFGTGVLDDWTVWGESGWILAGDVATASDGVCTKVWSSDTGLYQDFAVSEGSDYDLSVSVYSISSSEPLSAGTAYLTVEWFDSGWNPVGSSSILDTYTSADGYDTWVGLSGTATAASGASYGRIVLGEADSTGSVFFDNASVLEAVPEPVSAALLGLGIGFIYMLRKRIKA